MSALNFSVQISTGGTFNVTSTSAPPKAKSPGGERGADVYILSFSSPADNRVTIPFIDAFLLTLRILERKTQGKGGVVVITSAISKFFSNGFDLDHVRDNGEVFFAKCLELLREILIYSMHTIAYINGHCFGAGVFVALACDYRIQNASKGFICLPEVDLGVPVPTSMAALVKAKLPTLNVYRDMVFTGKRFNGPESLKAGIVDALGGSVEDAIEFGQDRGLVDKSSQGILGALKEDLYKEVLAMFDKEKDNVAWRIKMDDERAARLDALAKLVESWEKKAKL